MGLRFWKTREFGTALVLIAMLIACEIASQVNTHSSFLLSGQLPRLLQDASFVGIAAVGACIVIISGGVDLSAGSAMSLAAVTFAYCYQIRGQSGLAALMNAIVAAGGVGSVCGFLIGKLKLPPFIATFGFLSIARGLSYRATGGPSISVSWESRPSFFFPLLANHTAWLMLFLVIVATVAMARFKWGRYVYAIGGNEEAARFSGLRVDWIKCGIYTVAGLFSGLAGAAMALRYGSAYVAIANGYELQIIAACAVGGVSFSGGQGSVVGAALGAVTLQVLRILLIQLRVEPAMVEIAYGAAVIGAVAFDLHRGGKGLGGWLGIKTK
jgi:ribose/xylose/arabinose/galactoside ABC-type transport system permease subunit